jgi:hypothetical protein
MLIAWISYLVFLALFAIIDLAVIYHVYKYSYPQDNSRIVILVYNAVAITIIISTIATVAIF